MGLDLGSIGSAIMGSSLPIVSSAASLAGGVLQTDAMQNMQWNQENFQAGQRATAYQTAVGDLKAAGLNPVLAAGASPMAMSGSGPVSLPNVGQAAVASAQEARSVQADLDTKEAQRKLLDAQASEADSRKSVNQVEAARGYEDLSRGGPGARVGATVAGADRDSASAALSRAQVPEIGQRIANMQGELRNMPKTGNLLDVQTHLERVRTALVDAQAKGQLQSNVLKPVLDGLRAKLDALQVPRAQNDADFQLTEWAKKAQGWIDSLPFSASLGIHR